MAGSGTASTLVCLLSSCFQPNSLVHSSEQCFFASRYLYLFPAIFLCSQLLRFGINHVICHDEVKMSMLACATLFPAFLPFAINAMRSSSDYSIPVNNT